MIKRSIFLFLFLALGMGLLTGCSTSEPTYDDEYDAETDYPYYFHSNGGLESRIAASDQGYYMLNGNYLYYMDKDGDTLVLLDNRPDNECLESRDGENCNAYVSLDVSFSSLFQYYQDYLYTIEYRHYADMKEISENEFKEGEYELVRRDTDGNNRKVLRTFSHANILEAGIHRGYLYYVVEDRDKDNEFIYQILCLSLKKPSKEPEVIYTGSNKEGSITQMIPYGSQIYFYEWTADDLYRVKRYDLNDLSVSTLLDISEDGGYPGLEAIYKDQLYFWYYYYHNRVAENSDITDERGLKIYTADLAGNNIREIDIQASEILSKVHVDNNYTYVRPVYYYLRGLDNQVPDEMKIYQEDQLVQVVDTSHIPTLDLYTGDERYMFAYHWDEDGHYIYILDKREIKSGKAQFKTLIETPQINQDTISEDIGES